MIAGTVMCTLLSFGLACSGTARAANGWYVGGSAGLSHYDIGTDDFMPEPGLTTSASIDDEDTLWKLFGGYRMNDHVAFEAAYADLGSYDVTTTVTAPFAARNHGEFDATALLVDVVGILPFADRYEVFGKVGLAVWEIGVDVSGTAGGARVSPDFDDDGSDFHYAVGVATHFADSVAVRAEWEAIDLAEDLSTWSIGIQFDL